MRQHLDGDDRDEQSQGKADGDPDGRKQEAVRRDKPDELAARRADTAELAELADALLDAYRQSRADDERCTEARDDGQQDEAEVEHAGFVLELGALRAGGHGNGRGADRFGQGLRVGLEIGRLRREFQVDDVIAHRRGQVRGQRLDGHVHRGLRQELDLRAFDNADHGDGARRGGFGRELGGIPDVEVHDLRNGGIDDDFTRRAGERPPGLVRLGTEAFLKGPAGAVRPGLDRRVDADHVEPTVFIALGDGGIRLHASGGQGYLGAGAELFEKGRRQAGIGAALRGPDMHLRDAQQLRQPLAHTRTQRIEAGADAHDQRDRRGDRQGAQHRPQRPSEPLPDSEPQADRHRLSSPRGIPRK